MFSLNRRTWLFTTPEYTVFGLYDPVQIHASLEVLILYQNYLIRSIDTILIAAFSSWYVYWTAIAGLVYRSVFLEISLMNVFNFFQICLRACILSHRGSVVSPVIIWVEDERFLLILRCRSLRKFESMKLSCVNIWNVTKRHRSYCMYAKSLGPGRSWIFVFWVFFVLFFHLSCFWSYYLTVLVRCWIPME